MNSKKNWIVFGGLLLVLHLPLSQALAETLKQSVTSAVASNPDIYIKLKGWMAAKEGIAKAHGGYLPSLDVTGTLGTNHLKSSNTDFQTEHLNPQGVDVVITQMLFDGFATKNEVARNKSLTTAENYQTQGTAEDVALLAIKSYLDVVRTKLIAAYAQQNYISHSETYTTIKKLATQGVGRQAEATQAYGRLALAKANFLAAQNNYDNSKITYFKVVGRQAKNLQLPDAPDDNAMPTSKAQATQNAIYNNPILKAAKADIEEARAQYNSAKATNYPRLDAVLTASQGHDIRGDEGKTKDYAAQLRLKYNLFKGGSDMASQRQTAQLLEQAQQIRNRTYDQVVENVQLAWNFWETNKAQFQYFKQHQAAAKASAESYMKQFQIGKRAMLDLLDAQDEVFNAQSDYITGIINIIYSEYRVLNAEGRLLSYLKINVPGYSTPMQDDTEFLHIQPSTTRTKFIDND